MRAFATAALPLRSSCPVPSSALSTFVSTRETKKLATEADLSIDSPFSTRRSRPVMNASAIAS